jgi:hypothetical protein
LILEDKFDLTGSVNQQLSGESNINAAKLDKIT